jgi:hypothetical protein
MAAVLYLSAWRNAWKYQARTYRHCFWDAGTLLANLNVSTQAWWPLFNLGSNWSEELENLRNRESANHQDENDEPYDDLSVQSFRHCRSSRTERCVALTIVGMLFAPRARSHASIQG